MQATTLNIHDRPKHFCELTLEEITDVLLKLELPDGTKIDPNTAKSSLFRTTPMLKNKLYHYKDVFQYLSENDKKSGEWKKICDELEAKVKECEKVLDSSR